MKHLFLKTIGTILIIILGFQVLQAQGSSNTVNFKVTYDSASETYTAWVVPNYNVPNSINSGSTERGATAQFTIMVPADFVIQNITDIKGIWDKNPLKIGPGIPGQNLPSIGLDPTINYYMIGKSSSETDYGIFQIGQDVALFTFRSNSCFGPVSVLPPNHPFIAIADQTFSLNVGNSFYSASGQAAGGNQNPLEQFSNISGTAAQCSSTPEPTSDISINKSVNKSTALLNDVLTYTVVVKNLGGVTATNIVVEDSLGAGLQFLTGSPTNGTFAYPNLNIPSLAVGDSVVLTITARVLVEGVSNNYAMLKSLDQIDPNTSNNSTSTCVSVPITLCTGDTAELTVPSEYSQVIWFRNGVQVGTGNTILASQTGTYTIMALNTTCPSSGCCPVEILVRDCCPVNLCIPITISKIRR